jgi:hypothetical protein
MTKNILKKLAIVIAVGTSIYAFDCFRIAQVQRSAIREIRHVSNCVLGFDNPRVHAIDLNEIFTQDEPRLPMRTWTEAVFGFDLVHRCRSVEILSNELDEALPYLLKLPYLEELSIVTTRESNDRPSMLEGGKRTRTRAYSNEN